MLPSALSSAPPRPTALRCSIPSASCCQPNDPATRSLGRGEQLHCLARSLRTLLRIFWKQAMIHSASNNLKNITDDWAVRSYPARWMVPCQAIFSVSESVRSIPDVAGHQQRDHLVGRQHRGEEPVEALERWCLVDNPTTAACVAHHDRHVAEVTCSSG